MNVYSFFSGIGGNSLGYKQAGHSIIYANEILKSSANTYEYNHNLEVDRRDIRKISGKELVKLYGKPDIIDGSPPCASYSMAGKREAGYGKSKLYAGEIEQRTDDLLGEFIRITLEINPDHIVFENVAGLSIGKAYKTLQDTARVYQKEGYKVKAFILNAKDYGVPQSRSRLFFRASKPYIPKQPKPTESGISIAKAIGLIKNSKEELEEINIEKYAIGKEWHKLKQGETSKKYFNLTRTHPNRICPTITATPYQSKSAAGITHYSECRFFTYPELLKLSGFPETFKFIGTLKQGRERLGRIVCPPVMKAIAETIT